ncbi:MAG: (d)CMP kinase [Alphaproteobacteria bacterium]|nr:(d)CMP kinase [Alphaproteobacteria bacterium]
MLKSAIGLKETPASIVIAIDGPAASGKGTIARRLAEVLGFDYLDTGVLYRAVGWTVLQHGRSPSIVFEATRVAETLKLASIDETVLRSDEVADAASKVAAIPEVRTALLDHQRHFAKNPPRGRGAVIDGRDIGTVVIPDAHVKIFVTARDEVRAHRRYLDLRPDNPDLREGQVLSELRARDRRDMERATAPLKPAGDAILLETSELDIDSAVAAALAIVERTLRQKKSAPGLQAMASGVGRPNEIQKQA